MKNFVFTSIIQFRENSNWLRKGERERENSSRGDVRATRGKRKSDPTDFHDFRSHSPRRSFPGGISFTAADLIGREISFSRSNLSLSLSLSLFLVARPFVIDGSIVAPVRLIPSITRHLLALKALSIELEGKTGSPTTGNALNLRHRRRTFRETKAPVFFFPSIENYPYSDTVFLPLIFTYIGWAKNHFLLK